AHFHFSRSEFSYKRKNKKSQDELFIIFLSQFPVKYRIGFQLQIWHPEIKKVKENFMRDIVMKESNLCSVLLYMKDFPSNDPESETVKDYTVCNQQDLFMVTDWLAQTLQYELIPMCEQMNSIEAMEKFFQSSADWSLNTHNGGNICTDLIVAKLTHKRDIHKRYNELLEGIKKKIENQHMSPESRELLTLCYESIR
ncbi:MAG TPA: hypothetical protein VHQ04_08420, partial [Puia sp.]|nr:hypothetical protein [Puia sp.]